MPNNHICKIRKQKGLKLTELANLTHLSTGYLCHLEKGSRSNPSMNTMKKICDALNMNLKDVFFI